MPSWELQRCYIGFVAGLGIGVLVDCIIYMAFYMPQIKENK